MKAQPPVPLIRQVCLVFHSHRPGQVSAGRPTTTLIHRTFHLSSISNPTCCVAHMMVLLLSPSERGVPSPLQLRQRPVDRRTLASVAAALTMLALVVVVAVPSVTVVAAFNNGGGPSSHRLVSPTPAAAAAARRPGSFATLQTAATFSTTSTTTMSTTRLYHMGHSHSHSHGHGQRQPKPKDAADVHDDDNDGDSNGGGPHSKPGRSVVAGFLTTQRIVRRMALWIFCWVATCGPTVLATHRLPNRSDWMAFFMAGALLSSADKVRGAVMTSLHKLRGFRDGIVKHSGAPMAAGVGTGGFEGTVGTGADGAAAVVTTSYSYGSTLDTTEADRVTWIGVVLNVFLSVGKLVVGVSQHSSALIADAGHSLSDLVSDFITLWSVRVARLPPDDDHPYGHSKFEAIGSLFLSLTLLATGLSVGVMANRQLVSVLWASSKGAAATKNSIPVPIPGPIALVMAGVSIASKEWLYRITKRVGDKLNSPVVLANAWHHRSDAYSSVLALLSIAWAMMGYPAADAAAGMLVAGMICMTGGDILVESVKQLSDSADEKLQDEISDILSDATMIRDGDVIGTTSIRARQVGSSAVVDLTVEISPALSTTATRAVEERVRRHLVTSLEQQYGRQWGSVTATVHAKPSLPPMPMPTTQLLRAPPQQEHGQIEGGVETGMGDHDDNDRRSISDVDSSVASISASQIEYQVRQRATTLYPKIHSVEGVTVHYSSLPLSSLTVDVNIRTKASGTTTLEQLQGYGHELKHMLEESLPDIELARVYLDLTE